MPRVRILAGLAGTPHRPGEELDLPADQARQMVAEGRAEFVGDVRETPEDAITAERRPRVRTRGGQTAETR